MDWIERLLHISPDGGSGFTEILYVLAVVSALGAVALHRVVRRRRSSPPAGEDGEP